MSQQYGWTPPPPSYGRVAVPPPASTLAPARPTLGSSVVFVGGWLVLLWVLEALDVVLLGALDGFGVSPRVIAELPQVLTAPFLHFGFEHLMANSLPFLVLGVLARMAGRRPFWVATLASILVSGLFAWLLSAPSTVTAGASGLVFGWLAFLLVRGLFNRNWKQILISAAVFGFFGGMLWGVFPTLPGVSWQGHLGGAVGGVLAAWWLQRRG
ncbi:rhomboid family intramembrane serine protease [Propioniciclava sp. MC1595]|uniref:rhomboid family intramembrane serine protease n=1 Tax=unclassified Propioniciclava TaxID=2642922 RepID=UPI001601725C|nr:MULTISPECIES: rhomboid family intramembrane serine protease [unclassified Propioniciclava]MBB1494404.1 rhomboid family intramembrane serine protease [Propioniciclava sp. MC1595]MBB1500528.1 rhomboid family intramembrane serine protease [Propioniciclava sp. MC1683]QTE27224.1 rhomboid family intramembrane serine protease [Propioniciclava sp. MC1595]